MSLVEDAVLHWLAGQAADVEADTSAALAAQSPAARRKRDAKAIARELAAVDNQLTELTMHLSQRLVPPAAYASARDEIEGQRVRLEEQLGQAEIDGLAANPGPIAAALLDEWDERSVESRRATLRKLIRCVIVTSRRPQSLVKVVPVWAGDNRHQ